MRTQGTSAPRHDGRYTVADYKSWDDDVRRELIGGVLYDMSPAPRIGHQELALALASELKRYLAGKPCVPFVAPVEEHLEGAEIRSSALTGFSWKTARAQRYG